MAAVNPAQPLPMMMTLFKWSSPWLPLDSPARRRDATREERKFSTRGARERFDKIAAFPFSRATLASPPGMGDNASAFCYPREVVLSRAPGTYAVFDTSQGTIVVRLFEKEAPQDRREFRRPRGRHQGIQGSEDRAKSEASILRRPRFPSRDSAIHDSGRMPPRNAEPAIPAIASATNFIHP